MWNHSSSTARVQNTLSDSPAMAQPTQPPSKPADDTNAKPSRHRTTTTSPSTMSVFRSAGGSLLVKPRFTASLPPDEPVTQPRGADGVR